MNRHLYAAGRVGLFLGVLVLIGIVIMLLFTIFGKVGVTVVLAAFFIVLLVAVLYYAALQGLL